MRNCIRKFMLKAQLFDLLLKASSKVSLPVLQQTGKLLGLFLWYSRSRMALVTMQNICLCFPHLPANAQRRLAKTSVYETGKTILETTFAWKAPNNLCLESIRSVENEGIVSAAIERGRGLIFVIPHLGNWEMINHYLGAHYGLTHMSLPYPNVSINRMIEAYRSRTGTRFVSIDNGGIRTQLKTLLAGGTIGSMPDQEPSVFSGSFANFFGQRALTGTLIGWFVKMTGCEAIVAYCQRLDDGTGFKVVFAPTTIRDAANPEQALNQSIEQSIRQLPEQYLWSYKRFRTCEAGGVERYQFPPGKIRMAAVILVLRSFFQASRPLRGAATTLVAVPAAILLRFFQLKAARVSRINIDQCFSSWTKEERRRLERNSLVEYAKTGLETGKIWLSSDLTHLHRPVQGLEHLTGPAVVLTPPLGNRELVMRYLGQHYHCTEYYHPHPSGALDSLIRRHRTSMGISLVDHTDGGVQVMNKELTKGHIVTLCPDQQPRVRGGQFIEFFGVPALTTTVLAQLAAQHPIVFGVAIRETGTFRLHFHPCKVNPAADIGIILNEINKQLEEIINPHIEQYRWSDKRFNIRPRGVAKLYK